MTHVGDAVDGDRVGSGVLLDPDAAGPEVDESGLDVRHAPGHLRLGVCCPDGAERDRDLRSAATAEDDPIARVLPDDLQPERVPVEGPSCV
jgi:hypothetical protein